MPPTASQAVQVGTFRSVTMYPPGQPPHVIKGDHVAGAGLQPPGNHMVVVELLDDGEQVQWWDVPCTIHRGPPSGLVIAPPPFGVAGGA